jgi:hypothetical protein
VDDNIHLVHPRAVSDGAIWDIEVEVIGTLGYPGRTGAS